MPKRQTANMEASEDRVVIDLHEYSINKKKNEKLSLVTNILDKALVQPTLVQPLTITLIRSVVARILPEQWLEPTGMR
jgi:hypothetical protein